VRVERAASSYPPLEISGSMSVKSANAPRFFMFTIIERMVSYPQNRFQLD
jgi:hypothetical protein